MANARDETVVYPFTGFNFAVEIHRGDTAARIVTAAFAECDGLEVTMEAKTIREGGNNGMLIRLASPVGYGVLALKRGMTANRDVWDWMEDLVADPRLRADAEVVLFAADGHTEQARFIATRCLLTKLKAPAMNAANSAVAIEEMQLAYESLSLLRSQR